MRDIKFRFWHINDKDYTYFDLSTFYMYDIPLNMGVLEQYTGIRDKDGIDIYEGDVVLVPYNYIGNIEVKYVKCGFNISSYNISKLKINGNIHKQK